MRLWSPKKRQSRPASSSPSRRCSSMFAVLLALGFLAATASSNRHDCLDSLNPIQLNEAHPNLDDSKLREYILCPNTTFEIANSFDPNDGSPKDGGQYPLRLGRSNLHILCGHDGNSDNNCVLNDGLAQLDFLDLFDTNKAAKNVLIQGLTFAKGRSINVLLEMRGYITLLDCVFTKNTNVSPLYIASPGSFRTQLANSEDEAGDEDDDIVVVVSNCVFKENVMWPYSGESIEGLVKIQGGVIEISNTIFVGNKIRESSSTKLDYFIWNEGAKLTMHNNCFLGNDDRIAPIVNQDGQVQGFGNSVQRASEQLPATGCEYLAHSNLNRENFEQATITCEPADAIVCSAAPVDLGKVTVPCLRDLNAIRDAERAMTTSNGMPPSRTYRVCPLTGHKLGVGSSPSTGLGHYSLGKGTAGGAEHSYPIVLGRSNLHILCGSNGKSENHCLLSGGSVQVGIYDDYGTGEAIVNSTIQGFTFQDAFAVNVLATSPCDVMIKDCVFKNNSNMAAIMIDPSVASSENASTDAGGISLTVVDSTFVGNKVGTVPRQSSGLITNKQGSLYLSSNTFEGTMNSPEETVREDMHDPHKSTQSATSLHWQEKRYIGYVVGNVQGTLELESNCFIDNEASIAPVVSLGGQLQVKSNGGGGTSSSLLGDAFCPFAAVLQQSSGAAAESVLTSDLEFECTEFGGSSTCDTGASSAGHDEQEHDRERPPSDQLDAPVASRLSAADGLLVRGKTLFIFVGCVLYLL